MIGVLCALELHCNGNLARKVNTSESQESSSREINETDAELGGDGGSGGGLALESRAAVEGDRVLMCIYTHICEMKTFCFSKYR